MATETPVIGSQDSDEDELRSALEGSEGDNDKGGDEGDKDTKTEEELAAEAALAERLKPQEIEEAGMKRMETPEEAQARVDAEDAAAKGPTEVEKLTELVKDLRQIARTSKREQVQLKAKIARLEGKLGKAAKAEEEELEEGEEEAEKKKGKEDEEPLSRVEKLQAGISQIAEERGANLDLLIETMEQGAYKDIKTVCSRSNFDDIFEIIATEASKETGKDYDEVLLEVELSVWAKDNPYKYMYDLIKKYHPSYAKEEGAAKPIKGKEKTIVVAPGTIADKGGDGDVKSGWTAKRIDDLPEDELDTVPKDVYDKYMAGELK